MRRPSTGLIVLTVVLFGLLAFAAWGAGAAWRLGARSQMSAHGYIAVGITIAGTLALGGGLMWLAFYSSRRGYDDDQEC